MTDLEATDLINEKFSADLSQARMLLRGDTEGFIGIVILPDCPLHKLFSSDSSPVVGLMPKEYIFDVIFNLDPGTEQALDKMLEGDELSCVLFHANGWNKVDLEVRTKRKMN